jgi:hypothetical protein
MLASFHVLLLGLTSVSAPTAPESSTSFKAEYFVVDDPAGGGTLAEARAVCTIRRRHARGAWTLEREVLFRHGPVRVQHVEQHGQDRTRLVWRELGPEGGRTWLAQRAADAPYFETTTWGATKRVHGEIPGAAGVVAPLQWSAQARAAVVEAQTRSCLAPLTGSAEEWTLELDADWRPGPDELPVALAAPVGQPPTDSAGLPLRRYRWRRADGSLARSEVYRGARLITFRWHADGVWARPIDATQFASLVQKWTGAPAEEVPRHDRLSQIIR